MANDSLRLAIVGLGPWGQNLLRAFAAADRVRIVALCDQNPACLLGLPPIPEPSGEPPLRTSSLDEVLRLPQVDALAVAVTPWSHAAISLQGLAHGRHVFVEKPMALTVSDAAEVARSAERAGRVLMVGHIMLHHPAVDEIRSIIRVGALGRLRTIHAQRLGASGKHGHAWWSLAPHDLSLALALSNQVPTRIALRSVGPGDRVRGELDFAGDIRAHVLVSTDAKARVRRLELVGTAGRAVFDDSDPPMQLSFRSHCALGHGANRQMRQPSAPECDQSVKAVLDRSPLQNSSASRRVLEPLALEVDQFVKAVLDRVPFQSNAEFGLTVTRLLAAGERSLQRGGAPVEVGLAGMGRRGGPATPGKAGGRTQVPGGFRLASGKH
ncbi:Gfo/Idh/MocA family protein [Myxococcota bacterium]